ncbi:MAG: hypothetical protein ACTHMV_19550 [Chitinophagaceae bacterium]
MNYHQATLTFFCNCLVILSLPAIAQQGKPDFSRKYKSGEMYRYELTTEYYQNREWKSSTIAVCELTVQADSLGMPYESVQWLSQKIITAKDTTDESPMALRVKPYHLSLHPKGTLELPVITEAGMTGAITDFHTFYVAIHQKAGIDKLQKQGDAYLLPTPVKGNFGNGKTILKGEDCITISSKLKEIKARQVVIQTDFLPPQQPCLDYYLPACSQPVSGDTLNNIQMIMVAPAGKVNLQYGKERFDIISTINIADGILLEATMTNELLLRLKVNCTEALQDCQAELPWHIYRTIRLKLLR